MMHIMNLIKLLGDRKSGAIERALSCKSAQDFQMLSEELNLHLDAAGAKELLSLAIQFGLPVNQEAALEYIRTLEKR